LTVSNAADKSRPIRTVTCLSLFSTYCNSKVVDQRNVVTSL